MFLYVTKCDCDCLPISVRVLVCHQMWLWSPSNVCPCSCMSPIKCDCDHHPMSVRIVVFHRKWLWLPSNVCPCWSISPKVTMATLKYLSGFLYVTKRDCDYRQLNCRSLRCSWSIACRRCSNYIFILDLTSGFKGLGKGDFKTRWESFKFWDLVRLILETLLYFQYLFVLIHVAECDYERFQCLSPLLYIPEYDYARPPISVRTAVYYGTWFMIIE